VLFPRGQNKIQRLLLVFSLVVVIGLAVAPAMAVTLTVSNVEVTQSTQTPTNTILLVTRRSTAVRTTITVTDSAMPVANVTGRLHIFVGGVEITPLAGLSAINEPFTAPLAPQRANENDTLNFELFAPTNIPASNMVTFRVDLTAQGAMTVSGSANNLTFVNRTTPLLFFTRVNWNNLGLPALATVNAGVGDAFVRGILPVDDSEPTLYQQGLFPTLTFSGNVNALLTFCASCRQLIVNNMMGASDRIFLYCWAGNPFPGNGLAFVGGRTATGNTELIRYQRSYAHELTHNFGFNHCVVNCNIDQVGWDVGARLDSNPVGNNTTGRVKPTTLFDIQTPGLLTNEAWINTGNYIQLLNSPTLAAPDKDFFQSVLVIQGIFDPTGQRLLQLNPVFRYPWLSQATTQLREQRFQYSALVTTTAGQQIRVPFNATVADDSIEEREVPGPFEVMIPVTGEVKAVQIFDITGQRVFGGFERPATPPSIQIISPLGGTMLDNIAKVAWNVTGGSPRMFQVAYSLDGGVNFVPIGVNLTTTTFEFDATTIPESLGDGLIRVFASDGINTSFADVRGLSTPPDSNAR
jgi:hypothetical protein